MVIALALLAFTPLRRWMEASMSLHMLVQFPLVVLGGYLLAGELGPRATARLQRWNAHGLTGLLAVALLLALLMIPRWLDLAWVDLRFEIAKWLALLATGGALRLSWSRAGLLGQVFFLGNTLPMTVMAGYLFIESPLRLCNAYLLDDQVTVGKGLIVACALTAITWLIQAGRLLSRQAAPKRQLQ
ncbi:hypothetical protein PE066_09925 [Ramlibacter tataouinensis]|uniref:hypothetical protein n=1 Tax=Ramlibacter tataouinensis TaxID=94132 RepID=UPI0022F389BF|nr:hypothetical protein [Ramlibacter tataouinensis]WBY03822.1 hypothetical protein PE066_09925 [Ramlibacter tataouinensis]